MSGNKRNVDSPDLDRGKESQGNAMPSGTGTRARNKHTADAEQIDRHAQGVAGNLAGDGKGNTSRNR